MGRLQSVDPWLLSHGVLFILNFSILMPLASYLILSDRDKYYQIHCGLGILITAVLVAGWACLAGQSMNKELGYVFAPLSDTEVGISHKVTGIVARFVTVVVCIVGVILGVLKMPKTVRYAVRVSHGVGGVAISIFGPTVVWNGFVRLQPFMPEIGFFSSTPIVWYSLVILLVPVYLWFTLKERIDKKTEDKNRKEIQLSDMMDIEKSLQDLSLPAVVALMKTDTDNSVFFFFGEYLVKVPDDFDHPGGKGVLWQYAGQDITRMFCGEEAFDEEGRQRFYGHSVDAVTRLLLMRIGRVSPPVLADASTTMGFSREESFGFGGMFSIDEEGRCIGILVSKTSVNRSMEFPVISFVIKIDDPVILCSTSAGMKVRLGVDTLLKRTYTVVSVDPIQQTIQLLIKIYPNGKLTRKLALLGPGDPINLCGLSSPPSFPPSLTACTHLLIAAGTGLVPILYYIRLLTGTVRIVWSLRKFDDIFCVDEINAALSSKAESNDCRVDMRVYFTGESDVADQMDMGLLSSCVEISFGRIEISSLLSNSDPQECRAIMSGPRDFVNCMHASLSDCGLRPSSILSLD